MKKQKKQLAMLVILCVICIAGYFLIRNREFEKTDETAAVTVTDFNAEDVVGLKVSGDVSLDFVKENGEWKENSLPDESISQSSVTGLISQIQNITTTETVVESPQNIDQYGLKEPVRTIFVTFADGSTLGIFVGEKNSFLSKYYMQVSEDPKVYLVSSYVVDDFEKLPEDFVEEETQAQ